MSNFQRFGQKSPPPLSALRKPAPAVVRDTAQSLSSLAGVAFPLTEAILFDSDERLLIRDALALVIAKHTRARDRARARKPALAGHHQLIIDRARRIRDNLK